MRKLLLALVCGVGMIASAQADTVLWNTHYTDGSLSAAWVETDGIHVVEWKADKRFGGYATRSCQGPTLEIAATRCLYSHTMGYGG